MHYQLQSGKKPVLPEPEMARCVCQYFQMKPRVYIETSVVSYLTARSNRDLIVAAHQQITTEPWARRDAFEFYTSELRPVGATRMQLLNG